MDRQRPGEEWRRRTASRGHRHTLDDVDAEEVCGCGTVAAAEHGVVAAWRRRRRTCADDGARGGAGTRGARVRRRTGRSVAVLFLFLVLAVLGCSSAWSTPSWPSAAWRSPSAVARFVASAVHRHTRTARSAAPVVAHAGRAGWSPWSWNTAWSTAWNADAILDKLQRVGSSLMGTATADNDSSGKVLNFFPVPVSEECLSNDGRRTGVCLNTYECRIQNGKSYGPCALGFGVCCVFTASCGDVIENNVTYFVSPNFPAITREASSCELEVKKVGPEVSQLRLDFVHFSMGQPNRRTGVCESDTFVIAAGTNRAFSVCGQNSGQHIYFDVEDMDEPITILMNMSREHTARLWEIKVTQIEFQQRVPSGCLQYHRDGKGVIQTMNYAENGRHLANQDYTICMRQEENMCSIVYEPCDENSFKIGPAVSQQQLYDEVGGSGFGIVGEAREQCNDKIVMPCDSEEFLAAEGFDSTGLCDLLHCGNSFCSPGESTCRIESSTTPFNIRVMFGPAVREESPEDNLGMCLKYEQQPCVS